MHKIEFETQKEYWTKYGMVPGNYYWHRGRLLHAYESGNLSIDEFVERFRKEADPPHKDALFGMELILAGLQAGYDSDDI